LAALLAGRGCRIDVSLLDTQIATLANVASSYLVSHQIPQRMGTAHSSIVPYESFRARDGEYFIAGALNDGQFARLCDALKVFRSSAATECLNVVFKLFSAKQTKHNR
jgi:crotonobetainyl-CoA:carnitine CoA-transferase CaiB-like acyl-CoA transferase